MLWTEFRQLSLRAVAVIPLLFNAPSFGDPVDPSAVSSIKTPEDLPPETRAEYFRLRAEFERACADVIKAERDAKIANPTLREANRLVIGRLIKEGRPGYVLAKSDSEYKKRGPEIYKDYCRWKKVYSVKMIRDWIENLESNSDERVIFVWVFRLLLVRYFEKPEMIGGKAWTHTILTTHPEHYSDDDVIDRMLEIYRQQWALMRLDDELDSFEKKVSPSAVLKDAVRQKSILEFHNEFVESYISAHLPETVNAARRRVSEVSDRLSMVWPERFPYENQQLIRNSQSFLFQLHLLGAAVSVVKLLI